MELQKQPKQLNYQDTQITSILPTKSPISFRSTTKQTENYKYQTDEHPINTCYILQDCLIQRPSLVTLLIGHLAEFRFPNNSYCQPKKGEKKRSNLIVWVPRMCPMSLQRANFSLQFYVEFKYCLKMTHVSSS